MKTGESRKIILFSQKLANMQVSNNHVDIRLENFRQVQLCSMYGKYLFVVDIETNPLLEKKKICLNYLYITHYSYCYTIAVPYQVVKVVSFLIWHVKQYGLDNEILIPAIRFLFIQRIVHA